MCVRVKCFIKHFRALWLRHVFSLACDPIGPLRANVNQFYRIQTDCGVVLFLYRYKGLYTLLQCRVQSNSVLIKTDDCRLLNNRRNVIPRL